ncbi:MAG: hypothetical protein FJ303_09380 [Planctomycetes bacterium]|nr:hypothetical protein [Planctomycetota bacterium]
MVRASVICAVAVVLACLPLIAQDAEKSNGMPKAGDAIPRPFETFLLNDTKELTDKGQSSKGRPHCLVVRFGLNPAVLIITREPAEAGEAAFTAFLKKLDEATLDFEEKNFQAGVIVISPDARDSTNNAKQIDPEKIIEETVKRTELIKRLTKRAEGLTNVLLSCHPIDAVGVRDAPPKGFKIDPKTEMAVFFYDRMKVLESFAFDAAPDVAQVDAMIKKIRDGLEKRPGAKK